MPASVNLSDFSAGWCPSDDEFHGRRNALLKMDNLELDANGSLRLIGGTTQVNSGFPASAHTLYSRVISGSRKDYAALADGSVYRGGSSILTGGDTKNAGFGTAFNFTLIASGAQRRKDSGVGTPVNLGLQTPTAGPSAAGANVQPTVTALGPINAPFISIPLGTFHIDADGILRLKANSDGIGIIQSYGFPNTPYDWSVFNDGGIETDNDTVSLYIGSFVPQTDTIQIDFYLDTPNTTGQYDNYYSHLVTPEELQLFYPEGAAFGAYLITLKRSQFDRIGPSSVGWEAVQGYRITYTTPVDVGLALGLDPAASLGFVGGSHAQDGIYEYALMYVNNTGTYLAKSELGPASAPITANLTKTLLNIVIPFEAQVNEIWLFRRSVNGHGLLDQWYRVKVIKQVGGVWSSSTAITVQPPGTPPPINPVPPDTSVAIPYPSLAWATGMYQDGGQWFLQGGVSVAALAGDSGVSISNELWMIFTGLGFTVSAQAWEPGLGSVPAPSSTFLAQWPQEASDLINRGVIAGLVPPALIPPGYPYSLFGGGSTGSATTPPTNAGSSAGILDDLGDQEALTLDITVNLNLVSLIATRLPDKIFDIVGPIEGRWLYFTTNKMYPSDINDPDLADVSLGVSTTGSESEVFLWARAISDSTILVATSIDFYLLSGTFATLPDNSVDLYYRPLACKHPAITSDVSVFNATAYYLANDGWRSFGLGGGNPLLTAPSTDRLYRGITCYAYTPPNIKFLPGTQRFPVVMCQNKLWCFVTGTGRAEVFDFTRNYWRVINQGLGDATAATVTPDGFVLVFYGSNKTTQQLDRQPIKSVAGANQSFRLMTPMYDGGSHKQRKDMYTLTFHCFTGVAGGYFTAIVHRDDNTSVTLPDHVVETTGAQDVSLDLSEAVGICKHFQVELIGTGLSDFILTDIILDFDLRPVQLTSYRKYNSNFGNANKKRLRVWPLVIDSLGQNVTFTPIVDNVEVTAAEVLINTTDKTTHRVQFVTDIFGVDYGYIIRGVQQAYTEGLPNNSNRPLFELWEADSNQMQPEIVQTLPIAKRFDQVGPQEFLKFGKIKQIELRVVPFGGVVNTTSILPVTIYFNDQSRQVTNLTVANSIEASYYLGGQKGLAGQVLRIEIGPTTYDFHRYYMRAEVLISGKDTENIWVTLGA